MSNAIAPSNDAGNGMNPNKAPRGVYGIRAPAAAMAITAISNRPLGRLRNGFPAVRITNTTSVCVARDSTNHPVRKSGALVEARNIQRSTPNVRKS